MSLNKTIFVLFILLTLQGCTEAYPLLTNTYEEALVVEATLTNELKIQEIKLNKSSKFEDKTVHPENNAQVFITDDAGNRYDYIQDTDRYISKVEFQAVPDRKYQLHITTSDGRTFVSSPELLSAINPMGSVKASLETNVDNERGIAIRVNSFDPKNESKYYRYEYEETYKVIAPKWVPTKVVSYSGNTYVFGPNETDIRVCYGNKKNTDLIITQTNELKEDRVDNFQIRFISDQNYIITHRYSILVKQYIESFGAFTYYKTLKEMSGPESVLSPKQPGVLLGNIRAVGSNSKIIGYFDVTSVSSERIYFNYDDFFLGEAAPPYYTDCGDYCYAADPNVPIPCSHQINGFDTDFDLHNITYYINRFDIGYLFWVNAPCGDCTTFASNIKPPFWTD